MANNDENLKAAVPRLPGWFVGLVLGIAVVGWWGLRNPSEPTEATKVASSAEGQVSAADQTFANTAAAGGLAEVQLGQLAQQRAGSDQVKQFGQQMVADHTKANQELQQIARSQGIELPTTPTSAQAITATALQALNGAAFDERYARVMLSDHQDTVAAFQTEASSGQAPQLRSFAQQTLPILQHHLQMAAGLNQAIRNKANASLQQ